MTRARPPGFHGFTLIEVLVVLVILGVMAVAVVPSLARLDRHPVRQVAQAWQAQAEVAARQALLEGRPWLWTIEPTSASLLVRSSDGAWVPPAERELRAVALESGMVIERLEVEGVEAPSRSQSIVFGEVPPLFALTLAGGGERWRIRGGPTGFIALEALP